MYLLFDFRALTNNFQGTPHLCSPCQHPPQIASHDVFARFESALFIRTLQMFSDRPDWEMRTDAEYFRPPPLGMLRAQQLARKGFFRVRDVFMFGAKAEKRF